MQDWIWALVCNVVSALGQDVQASMVLLFSTWLAFQMHVVLHWFCTLAHSWHACCTRPMPASQARVMQSSQHARPCVKLWRRAIRRVLVQLRWRRAWNAYALLLQHSSQTDLWFGLHRVRGQLRRTAAAPVSGGVPSCIVLGWLLRHSYGPYRA